MSIREKLLHEFKKVALTTLYFFAGFSLLAVLLLLLSPGSSDPALLFTTVVVAALVVGKVVPVLETLMARQFQRLNSFVTAVLAKAAFYTAAVLLALIGEQVVHGLLDGLSPGAAWHEAMEAGSGARFTARMLYLVALFSLYGFTLEVDRYLGHRSVLDILRSRYRRPVEERFLVMRLITPPAPERSPAEVQALHARLVAAGAEVGAEIEVLDAGIGVLAWPAAKGAGPAEALQLVERLRSTADGGPPLDRLQAGVARGVVCTYDLAAGAWRRILRLGPTVHRARELADQAEGGILFDGDLADELDQLKVPRDFVADCAAWRVDGSAACRSNEEPAPDADAPGA